jgi:hypothetical protein
MTRLGDLLVSAGLLTPSQRDQIVREQHRSGRPFGALAEEIFGLTSRQVESAWATQLADMSDRIVPLDELADRAVRPLINRRQAWQFRIVPLRVDDGELVLATTPSHVARALRFAQRSLACRCTIALAEEPDLLAALEMWYPLAGARDCGVSLA